MPEKEEQREEEQQREERIEELRIALERVIRVRDDNPVVPWPTKPPWAE